MKKTIVIIVFVLIANLTLSNVNGLAASQQTSQDFKVTEHDPQGATTMEKNAPKKSGGSWLWYILGAAVVAGGIAALVGGGASSSDDVAPLPTTGNFEATW